MILTNSGVLKLMQRIKSFITSQLSTKANSVHTHSISEIDDLSSLQMGGGYTKSEVDTLLNSKADTSHTHTKSQITDFPTIPTKTSDLTNDSGFLTSHQDLSGYIPLSGTSALAGDIIPSTGGVYDLGSSSHGFKDMYFNNTHSKIYYDGTSLSMRSAGDGVGFILGYSALLPDTDNVWSLGSSVYKWKNASISETVSCKTVVQTSDYRLKDEIESISDDVLDAWENLEPKQYKYKSDLETDKKNAQVHYGWIAQDVESVIKGDRKGEVKNGLWIHEEWEEQAEVSHEETYTEEVETKSGETETVTKTRKVIDTPYKAKGDSYGLRYTECLVVECAYLRRENDKLKQQMLQYTESLSKLEERLKALEQTSK